MKYEITHLKAPWPEGAKVGDVFEVAGDGPVPGWALGKVRPAPDSAKATVKIDQRKPQDGERAAGAIKANTPASRQQQEAETLEQRELREREEQNRVVTNGGPATDAPSEDAVKAAESKTAKK